MNKQLAILAEKYNLKEFENNMVVGVINGYQVVISFSMTNATANYTMIYGDFNETHTEFQKFLESKKKEYKLRLATIDKHYFVFDPMTLTVKQYIEKIEKLILEMTEFLNANGGKGADYCPICNNKIEVPVNTIANGLPITLCSNCGNQLETYHKEKEEEYQAAPGNYGKGLLGSIIGAAIGGAVWIFVGVFFGLISGLVAVLISFLAAMGYDKMKGKQNKYKTIINIAVSTVVIILSMYLTYVVLVSLEYNSTFGWAVNQFAYLLQTDSDILSSFIGDMLFSIVFGVLGVFAYTQSYKKKLHK